MYDYLDALTEQPAPDPLANGRLLFKALTDALDPDAQLGEDYYRHRPAGDDGGYLASSRRPSRTRSHACPAHPALAPAMLAAASRCAEAEVLTPRRRPDRRARRRSCGPERPPTARAFSGASTWRAPRPRCSPFTR